MSETRQLYLYQEEAVREIPKRLKTHARVLAVGPTGSGKTVIGAAVVAAFGARNVTWLAHRHELLVQAREALIACGVPEADVGVKTGQLTHNENARILCASISMKPRRKSDMIVVDEAHHVVAASYRKAIADAPLLLGLTATPARLDGKPLGDVFNDLFVMAEVEELGSAGYIAIPDCYGLSKEEANEIVRGVSSGLDYSLGLLEKAMLNNRTLMGNTVSECRRLALGERTIVCAVRRAHGKELLRRFLADGRTAEYLDGDTPTDVRKAMIGKGGRFERGETEVVIHVDVLGEGIDIPSVQCVALCRPTKSLTLYLQQVGRAARVHGGKTPIVLDHAGNCYRFGLPEESRSWTLAGRKTKGTQKSAGFVWRCECGVLNARTDEECRVCGACQPQAVRECIERELEAELRKLKRAGRRKGKALNGASQRVLLCSGCGIEHSFPLFQVNNSKSGLLFHSRQCWKENRKLIPMPKTHAPKGEGRKVICCSGCGAPHRFSAYRIARSKSGALFHSRSCQSEFRKNEARGAGGNHV